MAMTKKQIVLEDGRYLIYYTFEKTTENKAAEAKCCSCKCSGGKK